MAQIVQSIRGMSLPLRRVLWSLLLGLALASAAVADAAPGGAGGGPAPDEPQSPYAPISAVGVMLETGQALLWDESARRYQLAMVGDEVAGWKLVAIQGDRVIVTRGGERDELGLVPPPRAVTLGGTPSKPADEPKVQIDVDGGRVVDKDKPAKKPPAAKPPTDETRKISRAELERELGDFDKLAASADFAAAPDGGFLARRVDKGSWLWKLGLRPGDVVRSAGGQRLTTIDDAARVYAQLRTAKSLVVELDRPAERAGSPGSGEDAPAYERVVIRLEITK